MKANRTRIPFLRLAPEIWKYQILSKLILFALLKAILATPTQGAEVWQKALIFFLFFTAGSCYIAADLNIKILYAGNALDGVSESLFAMVKRALASLPKLLNVPCVGVIVCASLSVWLTCAGAWIFIQPRVSASLYAAACLLFAVLFAVVGISKLFCLYGILLDGLSVRESRLRSRAFMRGHRKHFWGQTIVFLTSALAFVVLSSTLFFTLPLSLGVQLFPERYAASTVRALTVLILFLNAAIFGMISLLIGPNYILCTVKFYREYAEGAPRVIPSRRVEQHPFVAALALLYVLEVAALSSQTLHNIDAFFVPNADTQIIAHRGGGSEDAENTLSGLETAIALGAYGSEIDIQRTLDGYYIATHDYTFERVAGDNRVAAQMTLEEIRQLPHAVPTLEEMLNAARGRIVLFIELKGDTADRQMCDDAVHMIRERGMEGQTVLISFHVGLIEYLESRWPDMRTGCLIVSEDEIPASLPCDYLGVEDIAVTLPLIDAIHAQGKKILVWTPNRPDMQEYFLVTKADAIITDNVVQAYDILRCLNERSYFEPLLSAFRQ